MSHYNTIIMVNIWTTDIENGEPSQTELLMLAFAQMMEAKWPFEEPKTLSLTDRLTRGEESQKEYITHLENRIGEMETIAQLQWLKKSYEKASGKNSIKNILSTIYTQRKWRK